MVVVTLGTVFTVMVSDFVAVTPSASVSFTVKVSLTALAPTVPEITPEELKVRPLGRMPVVTLQAKGVVPPVPAKVWEYPAQVWVAVASVTPWSRSGRRSP